jgi:3-hydroxyisobutyrate dehydrogenase-like beta-hydroxyacid dehydrogenase
MAHPVTLIGFGEAGATFAQAGQWAGNARSYDIAPERVAAMAQCAVLSCASVAEALDGASLVLSLVTADQALDAARVAATHIARDALYCDMNSVSPGTKQQAAALIEAAGGRYVDVAVMAPVNPARLAVPLLLSGPHANDGLAALARLGFTGLRIVGERIGQASTIKMLRSVMYKGMEALTAECLIACARAGVTGEVLGSFGGDWASGADYRLDRMLAHGRRRAAEMREAVRTLEELGVEPLMTRGTVERQQRIGALGIAPVPETLAAKLEVLQS